MNWNIRKGTYQDIDSIAKVIVLGWKQTYKGIIIDDYLDSMDETVIAKTHKENYNKDNDNSYVLEVDNNVVGFIRIGICDNHLGQVYALYILKEYKGYGFGRKLLEEGFKQLKRKGCKEVTIGCLDGNKSNDFYKHMGGVYIGQKDFIRGKQVLKENIYLFKI